MPHKTTQAKKVTEKKNVSKKSQMQRYTINKSVIKMPSCFLSKCYMYDFIHAHKQANYSQHVFIP